MRTPLPVPVAAGLRRAFATLTIMCVYLSMTDTPRPVARPRLPFGVVRVADCSLLFMCVTVAIARERSVDCRWPPEGCSPTGALRAADKGLLGYA